MTSQFNEHVGPEKLSSKIKKENNQNDLKIDKFDLIDRRSARRFLVPNSVEIRIQVGTSSWENVNLRDISLSGLSFWFKTGLKIDFKSFIKVEIFLQNSILFKGAIRPVWFVQDIESRYKFGTSFLEIENYPGLLKILNQWSSSPNPPAVDRRGKIRRKTRVKTFEDVLKVKSLRKINRRIANRIGNHNSHERRVVVVGLGIMVPNAIGVELFHDAIKFGKTGIGPVTFFDTKEFPCQIGGQINEFDPGKFLSPKSFKRMERATQLGLAAVQDSLQHGRIEISRFNKYRTSTSIGSTIGGLGLAIEQAEKFRENGHRVMHPYGIAAASPNACSSEITAYYRLKGPSFTFSQGCTSAASAIAQGYDLIKSGKVDCAIVGGTDAPLIPSLYGAYCRSGLLASKSNEKIGEPRPYDINASGTVISEGAACLVLEDLEAALAFNHTIYAELSGYSSLTDGYSMMSHEPTGLERERAIEYALNESGVNIDELSMVFGHGIGVYLNDISEYNALKRVFGKRIGEVPIANIKSMIGYAQGACAAIESVAACLSIYYGFIPPVLNTSKPFEGLNISNVCRKSDEIKNALVNTFGFGGKNVCIVYKKFIPTV